MGARLDAEQGIDSPPSVDPDIYSVLIEKSRDLDHVARGPFRVVFFHQTHFLRENRSSNLIDETVSATPVRPCSRANSAYLFHSSLRSYILRANKKDNSAYEPEGVP